MSLRSCTRREFCVAMGSTIAFTHVAAGAQSTAGGPLLWAATTGRARVYLFPFGEAKDDSWLTPAVRSAFEDSSQLWVELGPPLAPERQAELHKELGEAPGRSFFDALESSVQARARSYIRELNIPLESVAPLRPWLAYYTFAAAFDRKYGRAQGLTESTPAQRTPDFALVERALKSGKPIQFEMTMEELLRRLSAMPDRLQSDYIEWLFDYFDDRQTGGDDQRFAWMEGRPSDRSNERMRTKLPELYEVMSAQRNEWWARTIIRLLDGTDSAFIAVGQNHVLGPKGIPQLLSEQGRLKPGELKLV